MAQLIQRGPTAAGSFGAGLGQGLQSLGTGFQSLADMKLQQLMQQQQQNQLAGRLNQFLKNPEVSNFLAALDPQSRGLALQNIDALLEFGKAPQDMQIQNQIAPQATETVLPGQSQQPQIAQATPQQLQQQPPQAKPKLGEIFQPPALKLKKEALELRKSSEQRKLEHAKEREASKETKEYYDSVLALDEAAKVGDKRLNKMESLIEKGGLPISTFYNLFKNLEEKVSPAAGATAGAAIGGLAGAAGGPLAPGLIPAGAGTGALIGGAIGGLISPIATLLRSVQKFTSPNLEEFEKLSNDFVREAKAIFGSRVTDQDLKTFMTLIPTLANTDAGKLAIIKNLKAFNKANEVKARTMKEIIKENDGKRPFNLPLLVEERAKTELDKLANEFIA